MGRRAGIAKLRSLLAGRWAGLAGTALVLVVGLVIAARTLETDRVVEVIRLADLRVLAVATVLYGLSWPLRGRRYDDVLAGMGRRCGVGFLTAAVFLSQTVNLVVPARAGDGFRAYLLKRRRSVPYSTGAASLTVERLFDLLGLALLGACSGLWLLTAGRTLGGERAGRFLTGAAAVGTVAAVLAFVLVIAARGEWRLAERARSRLDRSRLSWLVEALVQFGSDLRVVAQRPTALVTIGIGTLAIWILDVLTAVLVLWAVAGASGESVLGFLAVGTLAVTVGNLAKVLPLSQGGLGLYEAAFTALVVAVSPITASTALAAAILDHALKNGVTVVGGVGAAVLLNVSPGTLDRNHPEPESSDF
ncbi:MAG: lysylphosphatidylglycerol synthase transmembrane domain-containing protein [Halovenus sp.]